MGSEDGRFEGYVEPLLRDVDILRVEEEIDEQSIFATLWEALVGVTAELLENQPEDQLAARIPLRGSFERPDVGLWGALVSLFETATSKRCARASSCSESVRASAARPRCPRPPGRGRSPRRRGRAIRRSA